MENAARAEVTASLLPDFEVAKSAPAAANVGQTQSRRFLIHPFADFWLLGGASILLFIALYFGIQLRDGSPAVQNRFYQLGMAFAMLSLVCNHPHFIISYKVAYGRGASFVFRHWLSLIAVPLAMIAAFAFAYLYFDTSLSEVAAIDTVNATMAAWGLTFQFGIGNSLGWEVLALSVWLMYLTVGWHYSKQVYGCMMVYAHFDRYPLANFEKRTLQASLYSVALYQFIYISQFLDQSARGASYSSDMRFPGVKMSVVGIPEVVLTGVTWLVVVTSCACAVMMLRKFMKTGAIPSTNFLVPWIAFHIWWVFFSAVPEFALIVPFFHSLQYLPFAYRFEASTIKKNGWLYANISARIIVLLILGFLAFEFVPDKIDSWLETPVYKAPFFFVIAFIVFINIHHFFMDSVAWRFSDKKVRDVFTN